MRLVVDEWFLDLMVLSLVEEGSATPRSPKVRFVDDQLFQLSYQTQWRAPVLDSFITFILLVFYKLTVIGERLFQIRSSKMKMAICLQYLTTSKSTPPE